jgi:N-acetylneuraminic acid mutarotase
MDISMSGKKIWQMVSNRARHFRLIMGDWRLARLGILFVLVLTIFMPVLQQFANYQRYQLDAKTVSLIGPTNQNLDTKFSYDAQNQQWQFNKSGIVDTSGMNQKDAGKAEAIAAALKQQTGGDGKKDSSLYSVNLPTDSKKGITYYDNNTNLSFSLIPEFGVAHGQAHQGRIIYPFGDGAKIVYTAKNNGMKEDIVLSHNVGDQLSFTYQLNLPDTLSAKVLDDGSVGIYSADPALFGNVQFASDEDRSKVMSARTSASKDHLLFALPAPVIKDSTGKTGVAHTSFSLDGDTLRVNSIGLSKLAYPLSVDPSVVITSSSDFATNGNSESNIDFPANQINRGALTGGNVGNYVSGSYNSTWSSATAFTGNREGAGSFIYNGYIYVFGGSNSGSLLNDIQCAQINSSTGAITGSWNAPSTGTINIGGARENFGYAVYDGYAYIAGGDMTGNANQNNILYAQLTGGSNCIASSFTSAGANFSGIRRSPTLTAYNGYLYLMGGLNGSTYQTDTQIAVINADGTTGSWATSGNTFQTPNLAGANTGRTQAGSVAYNGYLYILGGLTSGNTYLCDVQNAPINSDGTLGVFVIQQAGFDGNQNCTAGSGASGRSAFGIAAYDGYMYIYGGTDGTTDFRDVWYATITVSGQVGVTGGAPWIKATSSLPTAVDSLCGAFSNGYLYAVGGATFAGAAQTTVSYSPIDPVGQAAGYQLDANVPTSSRTGAAALAFNGTLYLFGGFIATTAQLTVATTTIKDDGTLAAWSTSTSMGTAVGNFGFAYYNGYVYVIGGRTGTGSTQTATVQIGTLKLNGTITWASKTTTATGALATAAGYHPAAAYGGYIFYAGGTGGSATDTHIQVNTINLTTGALTGAWQQQTAVLGTALNKESLIAYNNYLYVIGGNNNSTTYYNTVSYAQLSLGGTLTTTNVGSFSSTSALNDNRALAGAVVINGYMYVMGGTNSGGDLSSGEFALINNNGTVGNWTRTAAFTSSQTDFGIAGNSSNIYMVSGKMGGVASANVAELYINNGGSAATGGLNNTTDLSTQYSTGWGYGQMFAANGYLYVVGGENASGTPQSNVYKAAIASDGTVGSWSATSALGTARTAFGLAVANGYVYAVGGITSGTTRTTSCEYSTIGTGSLSAWQSCAFSIPTARSQLALVTYNNYLYAVGGEDATSRYNLVSYAPISSSTGAITSNWAATTTFTTARRGLSSVAYNGYIYVLGGNTGAATLQDVQYAPLQSNGTITAGTWQTTTPMQWGRENSFAVASNGYIITSSGRVTGNAASALYDVSTVPILSNGSLGEWHQGGNTPSSNKRYAVAGTMYQGVLYQAGGLNNNSIYQNEVLEQWVNLIGRTGTYSKLIDLGTAASYGLSTVSYNGSLPGGMSAISVRTADSSGVFGSLQTAATGFATAPDKCAVPTTRYIWFSVTIDDSQTATFGDSLGTISNVTDVTFVYGPAAHPAPNVRLFGGKFFQDQALQPLDTCA